MAGMVKAKRSERTSGLMKYSSSSAMAVTIEWTVERAVRVTLVTSVMPLSW